MKVHLASCRAFLGKDPDEPLLLEALARRGVDVSVLAWDDPDADWDASLTVIRSTWDYHHQPEAFLAWADRVASAGSLWNPAPIVRWNAHKRYLLELAARGVPVVPTTFVDRGATVDLAALLESLALDDAVVKPAVSASAFATKRISRANAADEQAWFESILAQRDVMVQPYVASVEHPGERALVFVDGEATHAVRKPSFSTGHERTTGPFEPASDELVLARQILEGVGGDLLYARVDLARDAAGRPMVMELELIEPSLYLRHNPAAAGRLARAIVRRLD